MYNNYLNKLKNNRFENPFEATLTKRETLWTLIKQTCFQILVFPLLRCNLKQVTFNLFQEFLQKSSYFRIRKKIL